MRTASANARKTTPLSSLTRAAEDVGASLLRAQRPVVVQEGRLISARKATRGKGRRNGARQRRQSTCEQCLHPQNHNSASFDCGLLRQPLLASAGASR